MDGASLAITAHHLEDVIGRLPLGARALARKVTSRIALGTDVRENLGAAHPALDIENVVAHAKHFGLARVLAVCTKRPLDLPLLSLVAEDAA